MLSTTCSLPKCLAIINMIMTVFKHDRLVCEIFEEFMAFRVPFITFGMWPAMNFHIDEFSINGQSNSSSKLLLSESISFVCLYRVNRMLRINTFESIK